MADLRKVIATIAQNAQVSNAVDLGEGANFVGILMPTAMNAAALTFQASDMPESAGGVFRSVYNAAGTEISVATAMVGNAITSITGLEAFRYIKVRSGTKASPVTQTASRDIIFVVRD